VQKFSATKKKPRLTVSWNIEGSIVCQLHHMPFGLVHSGHGDWRWLNPCRDELTLIFPAPTSGPSPVSPEAAKADRLRSGRLNFLGTIRLAQDRWLAIALKDGGVGFSSGCAAGEKHRSDSRVPMGPILS